jgi:hypothetical protein
MQTTQVTREIGDQITTGLYKRQRGRFVRAKRTEWTPTAPGSNFPSARATTVTVRSESGLVRVVENHTTGARFVVARSRDSAERWHHFPVREDGTLGEPLAEHEVPSAVYGRQ